MKKTKPYLYNDELIQVCSSWYDAYFKYAAGLKLLMWSPTYHTYFKYPFGLKPLIWYEASYLCIKFNKPTADKPYLIRIVAPWSLLS